MARDGTERRVPWAWLPQVAGELRDPVRAFPSYKGQRHYPWSARQGRRIEFESWVECGHLIALDFDAAVTGIVAQPFWLL